MTDYTPTTEEVRDAFSDYKEDDAGGWFKAQAGFDRWLIAERKRVAEMAVERLFSRLTRVTLIDDDRNGVQYERYGITVEPSVQDNGQTLKLFIKGS